MIENVVIEPMSERFIVWRCLHHGPLTCETIDQWPSESTTPWERFRERNTALLLELTRSYGSCAILARDGDRVVGHLRFYPRAVCDLEGAGSPCLQQDPPAGPADDFADSGFPDPAQMEDRTLIVHCLMTGSLQQAENPYQRKGIGTRMARALIEWARTNGWEAIEAESFEDLPIVYEITGSAGRTFWEKLGFRLIDRHPHPELQERKRFGEFIATLEEQAKAAGVPPGTERDRLVMRLDLT
jgi:GNAT superfamily N-acetyltransferase